ncbi:MAG: cysteine hydrolase family protein, partial [Pseudomonadota bacterium]|nr:cysteine hydrolase family protein [Pseudomonadota bacterium]
MSAGEIFEVSGCFQARQEGQPVLPAKPEPLTLNPAETAVIVVDLQNAYASKNGYLDKAGFDVSTTAPVIENTTKVLETARAAGMP